MRHHDSPRFARRLLATARERAYTVRSRVRKPMDETIPTHPHTAPTKTAEWGEAEPRPNGTSARFKRDVRFDEATGQWIETLSPQAYDQLAAFIAAGSIMKQSDAEEQAESPDQ